MARHYTTTPVRAAGTRQSAPEKQTSSFVRNVYSVLERTEYRRCESGEDLEAIYRLRYESYLAAGMVKPSATRMVADEYDDLPNAYRFGVFVDGSLVSTIRLHHVTRETPVSPSMTVFGDELMGRVANGETFIDPSRFAADLEWSAALRVLPYLTLRLAVVACGFFRPDYCLSAIKEEHTGFYQRILYCEERIPARTYPGLTCPVLLYESKCDPSMQRAIARFPFFASTIFEQRMLFAKPGAGELAPLTILPTAKYMSAAA